MELLNQYFTTITSSLLDACVRLTLTIKRRKSPVLMITCPMCRIYESRTCIKLYTQPMRLKLLVLLGFPHSIKDRISQVVTHLFNESAFNMFSQVTYPTFLKTAQVTALSKGDKRQECDNYRPLSVLPCISKIQESFMNLELGLLAWVFWPCIQAYA